MAYCHIAHDCVLGNNIIISNSSQLAGEVTVDDYAVIGGGTLVHQFSHLGSHIMIQGGSHVNKDVPPYVTAAKSPISYVGLNLVGLRRRGFSSEKIEELQEIYRRLFASDSNLTDALNSIEAELPASTERDNIINFIRNSSRGVIKGVHLVD